MIFCNKETAGGGGGNAHILPQGHYNILRDTVFTNESAISEEFLTSNTQQRNKFGVVRLSIGFILI